MGRGGSSGGGGGKGRGGGGGSSPSLSAKEQSQVEGMRVVIAQKGAPARQAAETKLQQLERTVTNLQKTLAENQQDIRLAPGKFKRELASDIKAAQERIPQLESQIRVIREAIK